MKIGTHNGRLHCEEALAVWILKQTVEFREAEIVRTRDPELLAKCDIVVGVGAVFDHDKKKYDHHQKGFSLSYSTFDSSKPWKMKLSSAGLIFIHYGDEVVKMVIKEAADSQGDNANDIAKEDVKLIYDKIYENLLEEVDAVDNGIAAVKARPKYKVTTTLSQRIEYLNPLWNEETNNALDMDRFKKAMRLAGSEFTDRVSYYYLSWLPAQSLIKDAIKKRFEVNQRGEIICLLRSSVPWKEHIHEVEDRMNIKPAIKYVLYPDSTNSSWEVRCVPNSPNGFENRHSFPAKWRGLKHKELSDVVGIPESFFVDSDGSIGGNKTYAGALQMALDSLAFATREGKVQLIL